jgi:tetratricopeptide (TPR) repeat protein
MSVAPQYNEELAGEGRFDAVKPAGLVAELRGRWQIPLLFVSFGLLVVAAWRAVPKTAPPPPAPPAAPKFEEMLAQATHLKEAGLFAEASDYIESVLAQPVLTPEQTISLHKMMVEVIYAAESRNSVHGVNNCRRLIEHSDRSLAEGESFVAQDHLVRASAKEWLGQMDDAIQEYLQAIEKGAEGPWPIRQHIIQLKRLNGKMTSAELHAELDTFLASQGVPLDLQFWAAEIKIDLFAAQGRHDLAEEFLAKNADRFSETVWRAEYEYLRAISLFYIGRLDEAERMLRGLREQVESGAPLYAQAGWLLGSIMQRNGAPEHALSFFDDVLRNTGPSPSRAASLLGRAECLADMELYADAIQAYERLVRIITEDPLSVELDVKGIRESARVWYQNLYQKGKLDQALLFLRFSANLVPPTDAELQAGYSQQLASLQFELGRAASVRAAAGQSPEDAKAAQRILVEAGEEYLRLTKNATIDESTLTSAMWRAAEAFDMAGERGRMIEVLESFVREYPSAVRTPDALLQLGRAYAAGGNLAKAVEYYQKNLIDFPRTPAALASLIPLADCFQEMKAGDKAEQTLLRIVTPRPGDELALITPEAPEYRDAIFRLGDLYMRQEQYEKAIARYEEAMERYADDRRSDLAAFHLADACRKSVPQIRKDMDDPKNIAFKESLHAMQLQRLRRAHEMFDQVIVRYEARPEESLGDLDRLSFKLSHLYSADAVYDLSLVSGAGTQPFAQALSLYEKAAWKFQREPIAMSAYVQIINCYLRLGKVGQAWMALQRARWALRNIPDEAFSQYAPDQNRGYWENYLSWLEKKPTFAGVTG